MSYVGLIDKDINQYADHVSHQCKVAAVCQTAAIYPRWQLRCKKSCF